MQLHIQSLTQQSDMLDFAKIHASRFNSPFLNVLIFLCSVWTQVREEGQSWIKHIPPSIQPLHSPPSREMNAASNKLKKYFVSSFILPGAINEAVLGFSSPQQSQMKAHYEVQIPLPPPIHAVLTLPAAKKPNLARVPRNQQRITPAACCTANPQELNDDRSAHISPKCSTSLKNYETGQKSRHLFLGLLALEPQERNKCCAGLHSEGRNILLFNRKLRQTIPLALAAEDLKKTSNITRVAA